jgi:hypothetical protein
MPRLAEVSGGLQLLKPPDFDPDLPGRTTMAIPLVLDLRRAGIYYVTLNIDGEELARLPFKVTPTLPPVG